MFRINRYFKGVLCVHNSCKTLKDLLYLIPSNKITGTIDTIAVSDATDQEKIYHFRFLSKEKYFPIYAFSDEKIDTIRNGESYEYNIYVLEMPNNLNGIFIAAPYWEIIWEISQLITDRLVGRMLYNYASSEKVINKIKKLNLDGRLRLSGGSFQVGGDAKIRTIKLIGPNILETEDFSFIFDNPKKFSSTEITLRYTEGLSIKSSLKCDTKGRFSFHHPSDSSNLRYIYNMVKYLIENELLIETERKPFEIRTDGM
jgi:hypothetical protein